jgi:phenylpropionate dioxygenase-like ring-hydroxylating dioxygenase large terminal subunit
VQAGGADVSRRAFFDEEIFQRELDLIFRKTWLFLAHESEIPTPGDYVTRRMGADPVIVIRDERGAPRVYLNSCRHRGAQLCSADMGNASHFRCSYHGWTYSNGGELRGMPSMVEMYGAGFDKSRFNLVEAPKVETYYGLVFATWDEHAPSLEEYLGPMAWYMETAFGKCEMEVVGPPGRLLTHTNWKVGAENYGGDTYHVPTTHKSSIDMGVYGPDHAAAHPDTAKHLGEFDPDRNPYLYHPFTTDEGHTGSVLHLPMKFSKPTFLGYEDHLWPTFMENLSQDQIDLRTGMNLLLANTFPNMSWIEYLTVYHGDKTPPATALHVRQWQPISHDKTELLVWSLVPKAASEEWKLWSQRAFIRVLGFGGNFEVDDYQNWSSMASCNAGLMGQGLSQHYDGGNGETATPLADDVPWPGKVYLTTNSDVTMRAMYSRWSELMEGAGTNGAASAPVAVG